VEDEIMVAYSKLVERARVSVDDAFERARSELVDFDCFFGFAATRKFEEESVVGVCVRGKFGEILGAVDDDPGSLGSGVGVVELRESMIGKFVTANAGLEEILWLGIAKVFGKIVVDLFGLSIYEVLVVVENLVTIES